MSLNDQDKALVSLHVYNHLANHAYPHRETAFAPSSLLGISFNLGFTLSADEMEVLLKYVVGKGLLAEIPLIGYKATSTQKYGPSVNSDPWNWVKVN